MIGAQDKVILFCIVQVCSVDAVCAEFSDSTEMPLLESVVDGDLASFPGSHAPEREH